MEHLKQREGQQVAREQDAQRHSQSQHGDQTARVEAPGVMRAVLATVAFVQEVGQQGRKREALCDRGRPRCTGHAPPENEDEDLVEGGIGQGHGQRSHQRDPGPTQAVEESHQDGQAQSEGRAQQARPPVVDGQLRHLVAQPHCRQEHCSGPGAGCEHRYQQKHRPQARPCRLAGAIEPAGANGLRRQQLSRQAAAPDQHDHRHRQPLHAGHGRQGVD